MSETIYHLVPRAELLAGRDAGLYRPAGLARDGFVHCTGELPTTVAVADDYFASLEEPLLVLAIDTGRLTSPVRFEAPAPRPGAGATHLAGARLFPHVYGPIDLAAVTGAAVLPREGARHRAPERFRPLAEVLAEAPAPSARLEQQLRFILEVDRLKEIFRQTVLTQSRRRENDAEHSWHLCLCVLVLAEHAAAKDLDVLRVLRMVILHDLVEIDAGDTFAYDAAGRVGQHDREARAAERIFGMLPEDQSRAFRALWDEFEARETPEARFAAAVDRLQPMLLNAHTEGHAWQKHGVTYPQVMERNAGIAQGAPALWAYASRMLAEAVERGILAPGAPEGGKRGE